MNNYFIPFFKDGLLETVEVRDGIPRFTPDITYSSGNFSRLRELHAELQLDSKNGTVDRMNTFLERTGWPKEYLDGKTVLECGCGAGPDTEVMLKLGAKLLSVDLAGLDIARKNIGNNKNIQFVQASIMDLPLNEKSFDIVFCHRVIQHTPDPEKTLQHILKYVKDDGAVFVHSYAKTIFQMARWKYVLLPFTRLISPESLYNFIKLYSQPLYRITNLTNKLGKIGKGINWVFIPFFNYKDLEKFTGKSDEFIIEYGIHDTFDALSPKYDIPLSASKMDKIASKVLNREYEIIRDKTITLLRTKC